MTGKLREPNPMPIGKEHYGKETLCSHLYAQKLGIFNAVGANLLGQQVACQWQWIDCPECDTKKVLVKAPTP